MIILILSFLSTVSAEDNNNTINSNDSNVINDSCSENINSTTNNTNTIKKETENVSSTTIQNMSKTLKKSTNKTYTKMTTDNITGYVNNQVKLIATVVDRNTYTYIDGGKVAFKLNGITIGQTTLTNGKAYHTYNTSNLSAKKYNITAVYGGTDQYASSIAYGNLILLKNPTVMSASNITSYAKNSVELVATVVNRNTYTYIDGGKVAFKLNGITIGQTTLTNGKAYHTYNTSNLSAKKYNITAIYGGTSVYSSNNAQGILTINKIPITLTVPTINTTSGTKTTLKAILTDITNKNITGGKVAFKINGITIGYSNVKNGLASINYTPKNRVENYTINVVYSGTNQYDSGRLNGKLIVNLRINILYWNSKGNITKNTVLYSNLVKSDITTNIINAATKGTPYVVLGDDDNSTIFITAGIHGSELSSQAAAIKLINTLSTQKIKGTLYIIPFVAPSITGNNTRTYNGVNLNSVANKNGTISNNVFKLAKSKNATALGDFHCTKPGGDPGKNVAMGTYNPLNSSAQLATYISNNCEVDKLIYNTAGEEYPGALEDYCNNNGITSVTCEVKTAHGTIASGTVTTSYNMMIALLTYYGFIS